MSELWRVRVDAVEGHTLTLTVRTVHPDAGPIPGTRPFAARLLADALLPDAPGGGWEVASVEILEVRNSPFDEGAVRADIEATLTARGVDPADWADAFDREWTNWWNDPAKVPSVSMSVRLTGGDELLSRISENDEWDSAAY